MRRSWLAGLKVTVFYIHRSPCPDFPLAGKPRQDVLVGGKIIQGKAERNPCDDRNMQNEFFFQKVDDLRRPPSDSQISDWRILKFFSNCSATSLRMRASRRRADGCDRALASPLRFVPLPFDKRQPQLAFGAAMLPHLGRASKISFWYPENILMAAS